MSLRHVTLNDEPESDRFGLPEATIARYVKSYFLHFHRSFPILHRPTFSLHAAPNSLLKIVVAIGSLYAVSESSQTESESALEEADKLWASGRKELKSIVVKDSKEVRESWVIQAFLLYIVYGVYRDDGSRFQKSRAMLRTLVDLLRDLELFHQTLTAEEDSAWETDLSPDLDGNENLLDAKWAAFISKESLKLSLYALVFLDSHIFKTCNLRPMISAIELGWEIPHAAMLWEANTSRIWLERLYQDGCGATVSFDTTTKYEFQGKSTKSLTVATQSLMSASPCPHLMAGLAASPFAALCVAANLDCLVQDFTRCYYQLAPSLSDPSTFHILSQSQNKIIVAALRSISSVKTTSADAGQYSDLWHTIDLMAISIKASLCTPDDLLIGGIVDNSITAGLATSAHLTLGSYFAARRSTQASGAAQELNGAGSLGLLAQLMPTLDIATERTHEAVRGEGPWATVVTIRLLLALWKALRHVVQHLRQGATGGSNAVSAFDPAKVTLQAVAGSVEAYIKSMMPDHELSSDEAAEGGDFAYHERRLLFLASEICKRRHAWPVGPSMATIFGEVMNGISEGAD